MLPRKRGELNHFKNKLPGIHIMPGRENKAGKDKDEQRDS